MVVVLTADEVLSARFRSSKFREGYDQNEVDEFLDRVVATLRAREGGAPAAVPVTAADIDACKFTTTKFREGYEPAAVDELLQRVRVELGSAPSPVPHPAATPASDGPVPGIVETRSRWRRLFGG